MQNSNEIWRQIGKIFSLGKRKTHGAETVSAEQFYKYFQQENVTPLNNILDPERNMETHRNQRVEGPIDYPITDEYFEAAIKKRQTNHQVSIIY